MGTGERGCPPAPSSSAAGGTSSAAANVITLDNFHEHTKNCGVRRVQSQYEELAREAAERQPPIRVEELMKEKGFKDYQALAKNCPQFDVVSWPTEFSELGSGYVLYFHFLALLALMFLLSFFLQLPAMWIYSQENWLTGWHNHDWKEAYNLQSSQCECVGSNAGVIGLDSMSNARRLKDTGSVTSPRMLLGDPDYGKSCRAWDLQVCINGTCALKGPGQWLCRQWCFVDPLCVRAPDEDNPSMTDRRMTVGLVRAYSACPQDAQTLAQCTGIRNSNVAFNETGAAQEAQDTIQGGWLTPGNFGPEQAESPVPPTMYTAIVILICALIFFTYQSMILTERKVDRLTTSPNDFAILVRGLPTTATDGKAIADFFRKHAVKGKEDTEIIKVVIGWDAQEFADKKRELKELKKQKESLDDEDEEGLAKAQEQINKINQDLMASATEQAARLRSSGVVVVVFRKQHDLRKCLNRWNCFWARCLYCEGQDSRCLPSGNNFWKGLELPKFPIGQPPRPVNRLSVQRAPNPGDINWEEVGVPRNKRLKMFAKTNAWMLLLIVVSFVVCYGLNKAQDALRNSGLSEYSNALAIVPALGVGVMNGVLSFAARKLGEREYYDTKTVEMFSQALKMSIAMVINTAGVMFFVDAQPREWYLSGGLVNNSFTMLSINAILPPFIPYFDFGYFFKKRVRSKLTQAKVDQWNAVVQSTAADQKAQLVKVRADIEKYKKAFAPSPMNEVRRYAVAIKVTLCCLLYMPLVPWLSLVGFLGMTLQYWMDKYLLLRWHHRPAKPSSHHMAMFMIRFLKYVAPLGVSLSFWVFLTPSWRAKSEVYSNLTISVIVGAIFSFVISLSIWTSAIFSCLGRKEILLSDDTDEDYYKAQYMWPTEMKYHKDHFLLKPLPESKNPEFLKAGEIVEPQLEDVKTTYGAATQAAAERVGETDHVTMPRFKSSGRYKPAAPAASVLGSPAVVAVAPTPAPATVAVAPTPKPAEVAPAKAAPAEADPPSTSEASKSHSSPPPTSVGSKSQGVWEFEASKDWKPFNEDCQSFIERQYQKFQAGSGKDQIHVKTQGKELSVNFSKMTQKMVGGDTVRKVRRRTH